MSNQQKSASFSIWIAGLDLFAGVILSMMDNKTQQVFTKDPRFVKLILGVKSGLSSLCPIRKKLTWTRQCVLFSRVASRQFKGHSNKILWFRSPLTCLLDTESSSPKYFLQQGIGVNLHDKNMGDFRARNGSLNASEKITHFLSIQNQCFVFMIFCQDDENTYPADYCSCDRWKVDYLICSVLLRDSPIFVSRLSVITSRLLYCTDQLGLSEWKCGALIQSNFPILRLIRCTRTPTATKKHLGAHRDPIN